MTARAQSFKTKFLRYVRDHRIEVLHDQGVHRCIRFAKPGSNIHSFTLTTWPGHLCISGDMNTYVFARLYDMFKFFRSEDSPHWRINPDYWSEKLQAETCSHDEYRGHVYSPSAYREAVIYRVVDHMRSELSSEPKKRRELINAIRDDLLDYAEDTSRDKVIQRTIDFKMHGLSFEDFWEHRLTEPSHHFLWACCAITWGIEYYDAEKARLAA